jgi:DNA repair exonuclease SbcCD ATPase subunit
MLTPKLLEIEGFRSFKEPVSISFPDSGAVLISGKYKDSAQSSGSGKSSILMAVSFALGFCKLPATELKNWDSKKMSVRLTLSDGIKQYVIIRDPKLSLIIDGDPYTGLAKGADEKLIEILQVTPELAEALVSRSQRTPGRFINSTDAAKKEFLAPLLKLDQVEKASDTLSTELAIDNEKKAMLTSEIKTLTNTLTSLTVTEVDIEVASAKWRELDAQFDNANQPTEELESLNKRTISVDAELAKVQMVRRQSDSAVYENGMIKANVMALQKEIEVLQAQICPTCRREWDAGQEKLKQKETEKLQLLTKMQINLAIIKNSELVMSQEPDLKAEKTTITQKLADLKTPLATLSQSVSLAYSNFKAMQQQNATKTRHENSLAFASQSLIDADKRIEATELAIKMIGRNGFLGSIFDEVLVEVESRINDMLTSIPNVCQFTVAITSTSVTKAGNAKKAIYTAVYKNGKEISVKGLSGGQMCSLELVADLAVRETIHARSGTNLGWLALDEAMDGMDLDSKQAALEIVKAKVKGLVLVVEHSTEVKEGFEKNITVEYDGKFSYVTSG